MEAKLQATVMPTAELSDDTVFEAPWNKPKIEQCRFYHSVDLPSGQTIHGDWDLRPKLANYIGNVDVKGARVLDMGTATGVMSMYMEQMGANVVSADCASAAQYTKVPYYDDPCIATPEVWLEHAERGLSAMKNSYWFLWHEFHSRNQVYYGKLIDLDDRIGLFDVGFVGQIMVHNRDPLGVLQAVAMRTKETLIVSEGMAPGEDRKVTFMPNVAAGVRPHGWFRFSVGAIKEFVELMGYQVRSVVSEEYSCPIRKTNVAITTMVADRKPNTFLNNRGPTVVDKRYPTRNESV
jgi:hypothetical protein